MDLRGKSKRTRVFALAVAAILFTAVLGGCGSSEEPKDSEDSLTFGDIQGGTADMTWAYIQDHDLEEKYGLKLNRIATPIANLYPDFAANRYPVSIGTPDGFATLAAKGVPVKMLSVHGVDAVQLLAKRDDIKIPEDLKDLRLAAATTTGSYKSFAANLFKATGFNVDKDAQVIAAADNLSAVSQLLAGKADLALAWEFDVSTVLKEHPDIKIVYSAADAYEKNFNATDWSTSYAIRTDVDLDPEKLETFFKIMSEAHKGLQADPKAADELGQELLKSAPGTLEMALSSGRQRFDPHLMTPQLAEDLKKQLSYGQEYGTLPESIPDSFFEPLS
jgi:hypothetical protein